MISNNFKARHIGNSGAELKQMLQVTGVNSLEQLINETIPASIRLDRDLELPAGMNEYEYLSHIKELGRKNKVFKTYIGMGYYNTITPGVIQRNVLENPGWYTSYTPYQAEISQGRLEALLNFQTMVSDLTAMPLANASLLDEGTSASEAMIMAYNSRSRDLVKRGANKFFVSEGLFPQTIAVVGTRANPLGIEVVVGDHRTFQFGEGFFGGIVQYPDQYGSLNDYGDFVKDAHNFNALVVVAADLLSLAVLTPPGEWGADVVVGSSQRFGIPMGFGGPHAGFFATREEFKRSIPGRIIGISKDVRGETALRMALQTREQHIKRERATSNICTAQALLASMAGLYGAYHGPDGLKRIAIDIHRHAVLLADSLKRMGYRLCQEHYFDTLCVKLPGNVNALNISEISLNYEVNLRYIDDQTIGISLDETTSLEDLDQLLEIFGKASQAPSVKTGTASLGKIKDAFPENFRRKTSFMQAAVFNSFHSETEMMRYIKKLENKDLALNRTMIPLGSCTMKLNAAAELFSLSWPEFANIHPYVPEYQASGYIELINRLESDLCKITGFTAVSFQPNSGAAGEYTGLLTIREYHRSRGEAGRNICLIPSSAHGTNPASAVMAGMEVVVVKTDPSGNIDINDLEEKARIHSDNLAAIMITYPSTHGVFEENITEIIDIIHQYGGQVYMDGANMNAQVGYTNPARIGADVCHLNLHKTFAIPHGGGGPGVGPIGVAPHLAPFLPSHPVVTTGGEKGISAVSSAPFGSAFILPISYGYIRMLGADGLKESTAYAILKANYIKCRLDKHFKILYSGSKGRVAHEMIIDCNAYHKSADILVVDIAKRLMDYGFHAPTVAFPVAGTLMVEPTESEPLAELDRFCEAMLKILEEIREIEAGQADRVNNVLKNSPHTLLMVSAEDWNLPYSRTKAAYPVSFLLKEKYFTPVTRIDDAYGDRNLVCTCNPVSDYE